MSLVRKTLVFSGDRSVGDRRQAQLLPIHISLSVHTSRSILCTDEDNGGEKVATGSVGWVTVNTLVTDVLRAHL